ncbi:putative solute carrier family 41 member 1-like [Scophthalmus maximus]|uniref:Putative solute carrier family 41 member 1-like n=1 Tax=Scophthalmus maximus TaxID=52904 RepID=A0A2U9C0I6_SCOMX|nr:putative solute carrier family 41 member 1-like [Scophthalmus maximus]
MPGEDKAPQQTRHRKKNKKSRSKGKSPGGSPGAPLRDTLDGQDDLNLPPVLQPLPPKKQAEERPKVSVAKMEEESSMSICLQVVFPYLLAGMGMVMAGMVLDSVQVSVQSPEAYAPHSQQKTVNLKCQLNM